MQSIELLDNWLVEVDTNPDLCLWECIVEYARGQGGTSMMDICSNMDHRYHEVAKEQNDIGWR